MTQPQYETCTLEKNGAVATVTIVPPHALTSGTADLHWDLGEIFSDLRTDNEIRVIVLTGWPGEFYAPGTPEFYDNPELREYVTDPPKSWKTFTGVVRTHQGMAEIEKPVVGKITGDAIGFGSSLAFACDLIVAAESVQFIDIHLGMAEVPFGPRFGIVTGDGGSSLVPLFMTPAKAKEYLMLAKPYTAKELAELGIINYAVPADQLDGVVDEMVQRLLKRSAYALAWTKRTANRHVVQQLNLTLDAAAAYEMVNFLQLDRLDGDDPKTLT
jgi:enoyl-CoA hydratase